MKTKADSRKSVVVILLIGICVCSSSAVDKPTTAQKTCVTSECHAVYSKKPHVHGPVGLGDCKSCHEAKDVSKHTFGLVGKEPALCEKCHMDKAEKKNVHEPVKTNCTQCHDPHVSGYKFLLSSKTVGESCKECHKTGQGMQYMHGPTAVGQCTICHEAHSSDHKQLLTMDASELCFSCHVITKEELKKFQFVHKPAENDCVGCHDAHGADNARMLKAEAPELCYPCHEDIQNMAEQSKHKHDVVSSKGGCLRCHTPHASTVRFNLKAAPVTVCLSCHDKPVALTEDETLISFTEQIENKKSLHGPVEQKDCQGCHVTHGSEHFRLLKKDYPARFYSPFKKENYDLCFSCHAETLVLTKTTDSLTDFRNGHRNLHFVHVNKAERGRTCRSCHATHASDLPKHIRESVPYGMWDLPIQFEKSETGGQCAPGCHLPYSYDRNSPVEYKKPQ